MTVLSDARAAARQKWAWPGGYPLYLVCFNGRPWTKIGVACCFIDWYEPEYHARYNLDTDDRTEKERSLT